MFIVVKNMINGFLKLFCFKIYKNKRVRPERVLTLVDMLKSLRERIQCINADTDFDALNIDVSIVFERVRIEAVLLDTGSFDTYELYYFSSGEPVYKLISEILGIEEKEFNKKYTNIYSIGRTMTSIPSAPTFDLAKSNKVDLICQI